jgi:hypothetical protein
LGLIVWGSYTLNERKPMAAVVRDA